MLNGKLYFKSKGIERRSTASRLKQMTTVIIIVSRERNLSCTIATTEPFLTLGIKVASGGRLRSGPIILCVPRSGLRHIFFFLFRSHPYLLIHTNPLTENRSAAPWARATPSAASACRHGAQRRIIKSTKPAKDVKLIRNPHPSSL